jgi:uncharacterized protein (DUF1330 family)
MPGYWIARVTVTDPDIFKNYVEISTGVVSSYGGKYLTRGGKYKQMEGKEYERNVIVEFPSFEAAEDCYNSKEYSVALDHARKSCDWELVVVEG